jgi:hypothetical protein
VDEANIDDVGVTREVEEVVTEARQRLETWAALNEQVAAPDTVLSLSLSPEADPELRRDEWALLALIDGRRTIGDMVTLCGRGEYAVVVALAELVNRGLVLTQGEGVAALMRRQDLIGSLEPEAVSPTAILADVLAEPEPDVAAVVEPTIEAMAAAAPESLHLAETLDDDSDEGDGDGDLGRQVAEIASLPRSATLSNDIAAATSKRSETFARAHGLESNHPEPMAAAASGGGMVATAAAASLPAGAIERDPSVNKSLLLRLIAGVRGL